MRLFRIARGWAFVLLAWLATGLAKSAEVIEFGGPRNVIVRIEDRGADYAVTAAMLPVAAFDKATNALLCRSQAEQFALSGLTKLLSDGAAAASRSYSGVTAERVDLVDGRYELTLSVPKAGIGPPRQPMPKAAAVPKPSEPPSSDEPGSNEQEPAAQAGSSNPPASGTWRSNALFTVFDDYAATIETVAQEMIRQVARIGLDCDKAAGETLSAPDRPLSEFEARIKACKEGIGGCGGGLDAITERANSAFQQIQIQYRKDLKVMSIERDALDDALGAKQQEFAERVQAMHDRLAKARDEMDALLEAARRKGKEQQ